MMKPYTLDTGYPVYGAKFITKRTLLTTGGGGEGNNGIPNKLSGFRIDFTKEKAVQKFRELTLSANEDCPMSLDAANNVILLGVNENSSSIKQGKNNHLRKFGYVNHHLKYLDKQQLSNSRDNRDYQKFTHLSSDASVACIATSKVPTTIYVVDPQSLEKKFELETGVDVKDMHISPDGKIVCYVCANSLHGYSTVTAKLLFKDDSFKNHTLLKVKFLDQHHLLIVSSQKQGISLIHYSLAKNSIVNSRVISKKLKGVTALDTRNGVVALCGNDNSLFLIKVSNLKSIKQFNKIHKFSITSCCFNKSGDLLATVSAANTVSVMEIPKGLATKTSLPRKMFNYLLLTVFMAILAIVLQWSIENGHLQQLWQKLLNGDVIDSSRYFKVESIPDEELSAGLLESSYSSFSSEAVSISASEPAIETTAAVTTSLSSTRRTVPETYSTATELKLEKVKLFNSHSNIKSSVDATGSFTSLNTEEQESSSSPQDSKKTTKVISSESSTEFETSSVSQSVDASFGSSSLTASSQSVATSSVNQDSSVSGSNDSTSSTLRRKKSKKKRKTKTKTRTKTKKTTETETETVTEDDLEGITMSSDIVSDISTEITNSADISSKGMPTEVIESLISAETIVDESAVESSATIHLLSEKSITEQLTMDPVQPSIEPIDEPPRGIELEDIKAENKEEATVDDTANGEEETMDDVVETSTETSTAIESLQENQDEAADPVGETNETVENENEAEPEEFGEEEMTVNEEQNGETVPIVDFQLSEEVPKYTHNDEVNGVEEVLEEAKEVLEDAKDVLDEAKAVLEGGQEVKAVPEESTISEEREPLEEGQESEDPTDKVDEIEKLQQIPETSSRLGTERHGETSEGVHHSNTLNDERETTVTQSELDTSSDDLPEVAANKDEIALELQDLSLANDEYEKEQKGIDDPEDENADDSEEYEEYEDDENEDSEGDAENEYEDENEEDPEEDEEDGLEDEEETEDGEGEGEGQEDDVDEGDDEEDEGDEDVDVDEEDEEEKNTNHDEL